jgi:hypothetical protein
MARRRRATPPPLSKGGAGGGRVKCFANSHSQLPIFTTDYRLLTTVKQACSLAQFLAHARHLAEGRGNTPPYCIFDPPSSNLPPPRATSRSVHFLLLTSRSSDNPKPPSFGPLAHFAPLAHVIPTCSPGDAYLLNCRRTRRPRFLPHPVKLAHMLNFCHTRAARLHPPLARGGRGGRVAFSADSHMRLQLVTTAH